MTIKITTKDPVTDVDIIYPANSRHEDQTVTTGEDCNVEVEVFEGAEIGTADKVVLVTVVEID